jgi:hypothetical protein
MNIILRPVDPAKRLPDTIIDNLIEGLKTSEPVLVTYVNGSISERFAARTIACFVYDESRWRDVMPGEEDVFRNENYRVKEWFEEVTIESLFPDDDLAYHAARSAGNNLIYKIELHQEGQTFFKNHLLKNLRK